MINCSRNRGKYIITKSLPDTTDTVEYKVYLNDSSSEIYEGSSGYYGDDIEIDVSDWIESYLDGLTETGEVYPTCKVTIDFTITDEEGETETSSKSITWTPDIIDMKTPNQRGLICGGAMGVSSEFKGRAGAYATFAIYPLFYFKMTGTYSDGTPFEDDNAMWDPSGYYNIMSDPDMDKVFKWSHYYSSSETSETIINAVLKYIVQTSSPNNLKNYPDIYNSPKIVFIDTKDDDNPTQIDLDDYWTGTMSDIQPLYMKDNFLLYSESVDNFFIRFKEDVILSNYEAYVKPYIDKVQGKSWTNGNSTINNINLELAGYGYKTIFLPYSIEGTAFESSDIYGVYSSDYVKCYSSDYCGTANLILLDSAFGMTSEGGFENNAKADYTTQTSTAPSDVVIPLLVKNGTIVGKTNNTLDKITYMDKYNDYHNSVITNKYEIECYIDPEWLKTKSGDDMNYEKLMLACQTALKSYLSVDVNISGLSGLSSSSEILMEGRVSDVTKITTSSRYSNSNKIPTYKITFELFK